jgi:tRNA(His) 5'-end guanylyltransferase
MSQKMVKDALGQRLKNSYEHRTRYYLPRRTYTIIRLDGKTFHSYTKNLEKPFDFGLNQDLDDAVISILSEIQGARFAFVQSDEISILLTDFENEQTSAWFDGNIQKICSVSASLMTAEFNKLRMLRFFTPKDNDKESLLDGYSLYSIQEMNCKDISNFNLASFDSRIFTIPDRIEVMNYFIWRNQDIGRNSVSMVAQANFSHKELQNKSTAEMQEMLFQEKGINWADYPEELKNGRLIVKEEYFIPENEIKQAKINSGIHPDTPITLAGVRRTKWVSRPAWKFTQDKDKLLDMIPVYS